MRALLLLFPFFFVISCDTEQVNKNILEDNNTALSNAYAKGFEITEYSNGYEFKVFHPQTGVKVDHFTLGIKLDGIKYIKKAPKTCIPFSATHISFLDALGEINSIKGVTYGNSIFNHYIKKKLASKAIIDLGSDAKPNKELILSIKPAVLYSFPQTNQLDWLEKFNIPTINITEFLENHPLAQAEWIRFFGCIYGKEELADSMFYSIKNQYESLITKPKSNIPVLAGELWSEKWALPGGNSITNQFITDAGGTYLSFNDSSSGSRQIDFEVVIQNQHKANHWLLLSYANQKITKEYLLKKNKKYQFIDLLLTNDVSICNTAKTPYFEKGIIEPHVILKELKSILNREIYNPNYFKPIGQ